MGTLALVPRAHQYAWAGMGEVVKNHPEYPRSYDRFLQILHGVKPYGDQPVDNMWNKQGMVDANAILQQQPNIRYYKGFGIYH